MRKYAFRKFDLVRERTEAQNPVVGRVIGFGSSAGHDWYKVASGGDVYNCRDDELELVRRGPAGRDFPPIDENEIERFVLIWRPMSVDPPKGELCAAVWKTPKDEDRVSILRWDGEEWIMRDLDGDEYTFHRETFRAWTLWDWPEIPEIGPDADIDQKSNGEEGVSDDSDDDQDDGPGRD